MWQVTGDLQQDLVMSVLPEISNRCGISHLSSGLWYNRFRTLLQNIGMKQRD